MRLVRDDDKERLESALNSIHEARLHTTNRKSYDLLTASRDAVSEVLKNMRLLESDTIGITENWEMARAKA